jgi:DNA repair exonuclease SbcCD ATPase subunit
MDNLSPSSQNATSNDSSSEHKEMALTESPLEIRRRELEQARAEYFAAKEHAQVKQRKLDNFEEFLDKCETAYDDFVLKREEINEELRDKRKEIGDIEKALQTARVELSKLELIAKDVRRETTQSKKKAEQALSSYEVLDDENAEAEYFLEEALQKLRNTEVDFRLAGGTLTKDEPSFKERNPWKTGSFYLFAAVIVIILLAVVSVNLPWYAVPIVFIGGLLLLAVIGALQLRNDESLSEENFLKLMIETFRRLPLLRNSEVLLEKQENQELESNDSNPPSASS